MLIHLSIADGCFCVTVVEWNSCDTDPHSLNYLQSSPLQKMFANPWFRIWFGVRKTRLQVAILPLCVVLTHDLISLSCFLICIAQIKRHPVHKLWRALNESMHIKNVLGGLPWWRSG